MAQYDSHNQMLQKVGLNIAAISTNATTNGVIIDTQGYGSLEFLLHLGARTDGTYTLQLQHGDAANLSDAAVVSNADDLIGALPVGNAANTVQRVGYRGDKRYVRANVVSASVTTGATVGVTALLGRPDIAPTPAA